MKRTKYIKRGSKIFYVIGDQLVNAIFLQPLGMGQVKIINQFNKVEIIDEKQIIDTNRQLNGNIKKDINMFHYSSAHRITPKHT